MPTGARYVVQIQQGERWLSRPRRHRTRGEAEAEAEQVVGSEGVTARVVRAAQDGPEEVLREFGTSAIAPVEVAPLALSSGERGDLSECESGIERAHRAAERAYIEIGAYLGRIRAGKLYRETYATFEDYCQERWGWTRQRAYQMIEGATIAANVSTRVDILPPSTEKTARPLAKLEPEQQQEAWREAVETAPNGKVTAAHVEQVAERYAPPLRRSEPARSSEPIRPSEPQASLDSKAALLDGFARNLEIELRMQFTTIPLSLCLPVAQQLREKLAGLLEGYRLVPQERPESVKAGR